MRTGNTLIQSLLLLATLLSIGCRCIPTPEPGSNRFPPKIEFQIVYRNPSWTLVKEPWTDARSIFPFQEFTVSRNHDFSVLVKAKDSDGVSELSVKRYTQVSKGGSPHKALNHIQGIPHYNYDEINEAKIDDACLERVHYAQIVGRSNTLPNVQHLIVFLAKDSLGNRSEGMVIVTPR